MQKVFNYSPIIYSVFLLLTAVVFIILFSFEYTFIVSNQVAWFLLSVIITATFTFMCITKRKESAKTSKVVAQLVLPLLSFLYICATVFFVRGVNEALLALYVLFCFACCFVISVLYKNGGIAYFLGIALNSLILCFLMPFLFMLIIIGQSGEATDQVISPGESYTAILISHGQGAVFGSMSVDIKYNASEVNFLVGRLTKTKVGVYSGGWAAHEALRLEWQDDDTLLINGKSYSVE